MAARAVLKKAKGFLTWFYLLFFSGSKCIPQEFQRRRRVYKLTTCPQH